MDILYLLTIFIIYKGVIVVTGKRECYKMINGKVQYTGDAYFTVGQDKCQRWNKQYPHKHNELAENFPEKDLTKARAFCRDPDNSGYPWCYVYKMNVRRQRCPVPLCGSPEDRTNEKFGQACVYTKLCPCKGATHPSDCCPCVMFTPPPPPPSSSCFPGDARILLDTGREVQMKDVTAGHRILTVLGGERVFSEVKTFLRRQPNINSTYLTLMTENGNHVTLSESHLLFVSTDNSTYMNTKFAIDVKPGDYVFSTHNCPLGLCPNRVVHVVLSYKQGIYVPLTEEGTLVVDGIFASCYGSIQHDIAHIFMTPFRRLPWLLEPWQQDGYSPFISILKNVGTKIFPFSAIFSK